MIAVSKFAAAGQALRRGEFFASLFVLGFANGIFARIADAIVQGKLTYSILDTFGISVLVWAGFVIAAALFFREPRQPVTRSDLILGLGILTAALIPSSKASWIALTALGLYGLRRFERGTPARRAAFVALAITVPMFWSRLLFAMLSGPILQADTFLVSLITGTDRAGNIVGFAGDQGFIVVAPACSSMANISLAVLGCALFAQSSAPRPRLTEIGLCLAACAAVIVINVIRLALMSLHPDQFELIHDTVGATIVSFLSLAAIVGINLIGVRPYPFARS